MKQAKYDVPKLGVAYMAPVSAANDVGLGAVIALVVAAVLAMLQ
jgi:predicted GTPase